MLLNILKIERGLKKAENFPISMLETMQIRMFAIVFEHRCWQLLKYTTREGSTAVFYENSFRIGDVFLVTDLQDAKSRKKEEQEHPKKKTEGFADVFKQACEDVRNREISYSTNGYTKGGLPYHNFEKRREYVH